MVKHIVLFKLKNSVPEAERLSAMKKFKQAIEALPGVITFIRKVEVGFNINPDEQWTIALYSEFDTLEQVKAYSSHPAHVAAASNLANVKESRACVDYEI